MTILQIVVELGCHWFPSVYSMVDLMENKMKFEKTERGFDVGNFTDQYGSPCSLQHSSLATEDAVWLGVNDPNPQILAKEAADLGIQTTKTTGWIPYPVPEDVLISTHMHLTRDQLAELIPYLIGFVETGRIQLSDSWAPKEIE